MRRLVVVSVLALAGVVSAPHPLHAASSGAKLLDDTQIAALETRADNAAAKDKPYLMAQVIAQLSVRVDSEMAAGQMDKATKHLNGLAEYTRKLHEAIGTDAKKLRDAEILVRETTQRMHGMVRAASLENQDALHAVESKLSALQSELMLKVFAR